MTFVNFIFDQFTKTAHLNHCQVGVLLNIIGSELELNIRLFNGGIVKINELNLRDR